MRQHAILLAGICVACLISQWGYAEDASSLREELFDLRAKVASFESRQMAANDTEGSSEYLLTERSKAAFFVGGDVAHDIIIKRRDDRRSSTDVIHSTTNDTRANLRFRVNANRSTYLKLKLDLDDTANDGDLIEECQFVFNQIRGSGFSFVFGKGEVPYGQDKTLGVLQSFHHNDAAETSEGPGFVLAQTGIEGTNTPGDWANPHANVGNIAHPGEVDNVAMIGADYLFRNRAFKLQFAVFQNADFHEDDIGVGMHEDRPTDTMLFQSFAARLWWSPTERLQTEISFIKEHNDSEDDTAQGTNDNPDGVTDQYALSLGFDYLLAGQPIEVFGEYQHGWDWNYTDGYETDTYQLGLFWRPRERLRFGLMGEWLSIDDDSNDAEDDYARAVANVRYQWPHDIYMIFEAAYEWYDGERPGDSDIDRDGLLLAFRMGWAF